MARHGSVIGIEKPIRLLACFTRSGHGSVTYGVTRLFYEVRVRAWSSRLGNLLGYSFVSRGARHSSVIGDRVIYWVTHLFTRTRFDAGGGLAAQTGMSVSPGPEMFVLRAVGFEADGVQGWSDFGIRHELVPHES